MTTRRGAPVGDGFLTQMMMSVGVATRTWTGATLGAAARDARRRPWRVSSGAYQERLAAWGAMSRGETLKSSRPVVQAGCYPPAAGRTGVGCSKPNLGATIMSAISNFKATRRLEKAGSGSFVSIKRRIEYIAMERNIPATELPPVLAGIKRSSGPSYPRVIEFCDAHGISLDWIYTGDLRAFRTMAKPQAEPTPEQVLTVMRRLPPRERAVLYRTICSRASA